jgi:putative ABC transport system substrate-binding protein
MKASFFRVALPMIGLLFGLTGSDIHAEQPPVARVGVLNPQSAPPPIEEGLRKGLEELGYVEGKNLVLEWRRGAVTDEEMRAHAHSLAKAGVDVIVSMGTPATRAALEGSDKPVVFTVGDPVASGFVASLGHPGGRASGVSVVSTQLNQKRLELLRHLAPRAKKVFYLTNAANPLMAHDFAEAQVAARSLGMQLITLSARTDQELDAALDPIRKHAADALVAVADLGLLARRGKIANAVREARMPAIFPFKEYHESGAVATYGPDYVLALGRAARYVDKVLRGAKLADLPVEQLSKYELILDLQAARQMHLTVPQTLQALADEIIK